jgi:1-phosphofructokinase
MISRGDIRLIYTITLNPSLDYKIYVDGFKEGELNRFRKANISSGGKGVNVSIVLSRLKTPSEAILFVGGFTGQKLIEDVNADHEVILDPIWIEQDTRINIKLSTKVETELNHWGPHVKDEQFEILLKKMEHMNENDLVILGGSAPYGQRDAFQRIAEMCHKKKIPFIMDTPGQAFPQFIDFKPLMMKPNLRELNDYLLMELVEIKDIIPHARQLNYRGVKHVIISLGSRGALYVDETHAYHAKPIEGDAQFTTGAGDSMVAGFVHEYLKTDDPISAFKMGVAAASATVFSGRLATPRDIKKYIKKVNIEEISDDHS